MIQFTYQVISRLSLKYNFNKQEAITFLKLSDESVLPFPALEEIVTKDSNDNNQKQDKMMTIHSNNNNKQIATASDPSLMENPDQCENPIFTINNKNMDSSTMISPSKTPMGDLDSSYLNGKPTSMDVSPLRNLVDNVMGGNTVTTSPVNIDNTNDLQPINVNFQSQMMKQDII